MRDLIQEDWRDLVTSFFFPRISKCVVDEKVRDFIKQTNSELLEENQETHVISLLVEKA